MMRFTHAFVSLTALAMGHLVVACSDHSDDCHTYSTCPDEGGTASGGGSGKGGGGSSAGGSGGGSDSGSMNGGSSNVGGAAAGEGGSEAGAGGTPITLACGGDCPSDKPVCKQSTDTCVQCLQPSDCATGTKTKCETASNSCVECLAAADCSDAKAAKCDQGACVKCTSNDDCGHMAGKTVCDTAAGECVECTIQNETPCAGKSCEPATNACTDTDVGTVGTCMPCVSDTECTGGNMPDPTSRCVPMKFNGADRAGGFCLRRVTKGCTAPFTVTFAAMSLSGAAPETFCGVNQTNTTCEAVLDLSAGRSCESGEDTSCGCLRDETGECKVTGQGGLCRTVGGIAKSCTYACGTTPQCPSGTTCTIDDPYCH